MLATAAADVLVADASDTDEWFASALRRPPLLDRVLLLTDRPAAMPPGAIAFIEATPSARRLAAAIRAVAQGLLVAPAAQDPRPWDDAPPETLTARELEILELLAEGCPNKEIARRLAISANTVKFHVSLIFAKLGVATRTEAVTSAIRRGLLMV